MQLPYRIKRSSVNFNINTVIYHTTISYLTRVKILGLIALYIYIYIYIQGVQNEGHVGIKGSIIIYFIS